MCLIKGVNKAKEDEVGRMANQEIHASGTSSLPILTNHLFLTINSGFRCRPRQDQCLIHGWSNRPHLHDRHD